MGVWDHFLSIWIHFQTNSMYRTLTLGQKLQEKECDLYTEVYTVLNLHFHKKSRFA